MDAFRDTRNQPAYSLVRDNDGDTREVEMGSLPIGEKRMRTRDFITDSSLALAEELLNRSRYAGQTLRLWVEDGQKMETDMLWFVQRCERIGLHIDIVPGDPVSAVYHDEFRSCDLVYTGKCSMIMSC